MLKSTQNVLFQWNSPSLGNSDQFAAWLDDSTAQPGLESSNQAFEGVNFSIKAFESENGS